MPVKLSGDLVEEARSSAKLFHRSLTAQIEHWATLGRAVESRVSGDSLGQLLDQLGGTLKIGRVAEAGPRHQVAAVLAEYLADGTDENSWLYAMKARGIPVHGTTAAHPGKIVELETAQSPVLSHAES